MNLLVFCLSAAQSFWPLCTAGPLCPQLPAPAIAKSLAESATPWDVVSDAKGKMKTDDEATRGARHQ